MALKTTIVVPLYMYPLTPDTWEPLHEAARTNPQIQFVVVLNPNSGPGAPPWWPEPRYLVEVPRLNQHPNICTVGYVRTDYCRRDLAETLGDVAAYGSWADDASRRGLFVRGIFFDETPNHYSKSAAEYLQTINEAVKNTGGILGPRLTLHNPGTMPDEKLRQANTDVTVVFEESLARYRNCSSKEQQDINRFDRSRCGIILHSTPLVETRTVVQEVRQKAEYLFVTDLHSGYYNSFGSSWQDFIDAVQQH